MKRRCTTGWSTSMATASASWPTSSARTRATWRTGCVSPMRPPEIRELVSLRKDSLSHAYELMKVEDPKKRRRLAEQVARGELTLIKLRDKIEGRRTRPGTTDDEARSGEAAGRRAGADGGRTSAKSCGRRPTCRRPSRSGRLARQRQAEPGRCRRGPRRGPAQRRGRAARSGPRTAPTSPST